jgi:nicotinamidase-related amidase
MAEPKSNQALLVIDIQNDFTGQQAKMPIDKLQADEIVGNINMIIKHASQIELTVVYVGNEYKSLDPLNIFRNFAALKGSEGSKLDPRLVIINQNYFSKTTGDAFSNPQLITFLRQNKISEVLIAGVYAEACILQTVKGSLRNAFRVKVVSDAIGTKSKEKRQRCLDRYQKMGVEVIETNRLMHQCNTVV